MKKRQKRRNSRSGFTLIEIMLVVVIIGLLAAFAVPNIGKNLNKARINKAKGDIAGLQTAVEMYNMDVGSYPSSLNDLISGSGGKWDGPYLKDGKLPQDPWGDDYQYSHNGDTYTVTSTKLGDQ